jgi:hypothetical protein
LVDLILVAAQFERMVTSVIAYPQVADYHTDPPVGLPLPYVEQNVVDRLPFVPFANDPTSSEWRTYLSWVKQQQNKGKNEENVTLGLVEGVLLTESCLFSLSPKQWLTDSVIEASIKSILSLDPLETPVGFLPYFFYTKLMDTERYDYEGVQTWFKRAFGEEKKVSDMSILVIFQNQEQVHWVCYGIFLEKKCIQQFDSLGGSDVEALESLYHWLDDSMDAEGKQLRSKDWCLYGTRPGQPTQTNSYDCGLFSILLSLCIAKDLPLGLVRQSIMNSARCQLWNHLMGVLPSPSPLDLMTPPPPQTSSGSVVDLRSLTMVPRRLSYQDMEDGGDEGAGNDMDDGGDEGAGNDGTSRSGGEVPPGQEGNTDDGQVGKAQDITSGNGGDDHNGDDPNGDDPKDDPKPSSFKKARKKGQKKGETEGWG